MHVYTPVTLELVRKRAEHNDMELATLEEVSLHQLDIEKIEHIQRWCPRLRILLLQGNLIEKMENLHHLKELQYLNMAMNNIEKVSGLEQCESLTKLDLTANFIIYLTSLICLQNLANLKELFLIGNPCTKYQGYRPWVINHLPYVEELDGKMVLRSEKIKSLQQFTECVRTVEVDQGEAIGKRERQKEKYMKKKTEEEPSSDEEEDDIERRVEVPNSLDFVLYSCQTMKECEQEDKLLAFIKLVIHCDDRWRNEITEDSPELRNETHEEIRRRRERHNNRDIKNKETKRPIRYFTSDGCPLNLNKANLEFTFTENLEENAFILKVKTFRYLDSSAVTCDVHPQYVRVVVKGQPLQIVFPDEVKADQATCQRSQTTGHLVIFAPKVEENRFLRTATNKNESKETAEKTKEKQSSNIYLELEEKTHNPLEIVTGEKEEGKKREPEAGRRNIPEGRPNSPGFQDDPDVPPLI